MKKLIACILAAALLLLAGCAGNNGAAGTVTAPDDRALPAGSAEPGSTLDPEDAAPSLPQDSDPAAPSLPPETEQPAPDSVPKTEPAAPDSKAETDPAAPDDEPETDPAEPGFPLGPQDPDEPQDSVDPWSLIKLVYADWNSYRDELGTEYDYDYELVNVDANTTGAKAINREIQRVFGGYINEAYEDMEMGASLAVVGVGFHGIVWEDILTLDIAAHMDFGYSDARAYSYEVSTGRWLNTAEILERVGVSEKDFLEACRREFRERYVETYKVLPVEDRESYGYYEGLKRCDSDEFVNMDLMVYPEDGDLVVIAPLVSLAGPDYFLERLNLGFHID